MNKIKKLAFWILGFAIFFNLLKSLYWRDIVLNFSDYLIDRKVITGVKTNNSYGIRNEVYDFLVNNDFKKFNINEEDQNILLNWARYDQQLLENFDDFNKVIEISRKMEILWECSELTDWKNDNFEPLPPWVNKLNYTHISSEFTTDHEYASFYYNKTWGLNYYKYPRANIDEIKIWCNKYKKSVLND